MHFGQLCPVAHLNMLRHAFSERADVGQHSEANEQDHEHDAQLEVAVQGGSQHLRASQREGLQQHKRVPEPQTAPAAPSSK